MCGFWSDENGKNGIYVIYSLVITHIMIFN